MVALRIRNSSVATSLRPSSIIPTPRLPVKSIPCLLVLAAAALGGCLPERRVVETGTPRVVETRLPRLGASSQQRFGGMGEAETAAPTPSAFGYDLPAGWQELPPQQFRDVNLAAPDGVRAWVTLMGPGAGGALGNLDRWRGQLGLGPASAEELDDLPSVPLLGGQAQQVDLSRPDGSERLIAVMLFEADRSVFVRMSGSPAAVEAQLAAFAQFRQSLREGGARPAAKSAMPGPGTPPPAAADGAGDFGWTAPPGWVPVGSSPFKLFEFRAGDSSCWLSELAGDGGGFANNVDRWCTQVGLPAMGPAALGALPRLEVLGRPAPFVALFPEGDAHGLLGLVVPLEGRTLFVKMSGPSDQLRARQAEFEAFCRSLTVKG
jgi:hypothetical protein